MGRHHHGVSETTCTVSGVLGEMGEGQGGWGPEMTVGLKHWRSWFNGKATDFYVVTRY